MSFRNRENTGPGIDVVELASASRAVLTIPLSSEIVARKIVPIIGNTVLAVGNQMKSDQNISHLIIYTIGCGAGR